MKFWVLSGSLENWETALNHKKWGVKPNLEKSWYRLEEGDALAFYVTKPVKGIIGFGKVKKKLQENYPLWKDEIRSNKVVYPYRWLFEIDALAEQPWSENKIVISDLGIEIRAGLNSLKNKSVITTLLGRVSLQWKKDLSHLSPKEIQIEKVEPRKESFHNQIRDKLWEIGKIDKWVSEREATQFNIDVVWRRIPDGDPTYAFEVHLGGNVFQALYKLKEARDKWNSIPVIVTNEKGKAEVIKIMGSYHHEIKDELKIMTTDQVEKLFKLQTEDKKVKDEVGLPMANVRQ